MLIGTLGFSQVKNDTVTVVRDMKGTILSAIPTSNKTKIIQQMDSLYYANPMKNNELCVIIYVNGKLDYHNDYVRREEIINNINRKK